jgi:hypothetical protein
MLHTAANFDFVLGQQLFVLSLYGWGRATSTRTDELCTL